MTAPASEQRSATARILVEKEPVFVFKCDPPLELLFTFVTGSFIVEILLSGYYCTVLYEVFLEKKPESMYIL